MSADTTPPSLELETRFQEPEGWRWHSFEREGRKVRYGCVFPKDSIPDAVVVCLQGVREFSEKYFETARWCNDKNMAFWVFDWAGQGKSTRYLKNPQKRHAFKFEQDIDDLHYLVMEYIKHSSVHPDKGRIPMVMLAHSMGANIGLRYLQKHPETFECAALSAPMIGIKKFEYIPQYIGLIAASLCKLFAGSSYVIGGEDWSDLPNKITLSSDPKRSLVHNFWCKKDTELQCGEVTFGWLYEAQKSCLAIQKTSIHEQIETPCLFGIPRHEYLVDNKMAEKVMGGISNAKVIDYPGAFHEILMEKDEIRDNFLEHFYNLIKENIIDRPETLKPF